MTNRDEQFLEDQINKILKENWGDDLGGLEWGEFDLGGNADQFYKTFIGPFVDVVKVSSVAFKNVASIALNQFDQLTTFDLKKKKAIQQQFREDRKKYGAEMQKAMASTYEAFNNNDAKLLMFMFNPGAYMGMSMLKQAGDADIAQPFTDYAANKLGGFATDMGWGAEARGEKAAPAESERGPLRGVMNDLKVLFFGEGLDEVDEVELILIEQEKKKEATKLPSEEEAIAIANDQMKAAGVDKEFEKYQNEIISSKKAEIDFIKTEVEGQLSAVQELAAAKTLQDLTSPIQALSELGVDLTAAAAEVEKQFATQSESMKRGDEEGKKLMEELQDTPDGAALDPANPEEFFPILEQTLIATAFGEATQKVKESLGGDIVGFVGEHSKDELKEIAAGSPKGAEFVALIDEFEQWYNSIMQ